MSKRHSYSSILNIISKMKVIVQNKFVIICQTTLTNINLAPLLDFLNITMLESLGLDKVEGPSE